MPRADPRRVPHVQSLAILRFKRYQILYDSDDLEQSILRFTEAVFLPRPWDRIYHNIVQIFFSIARTLVHRGNESRQPEDVTRSITYLRYLRGQSLEAFNLQPDRVTGLLVEALQVQIEMRLGDEWQDIEEMAVLCQDLLKSDNPMISVPDFIMILARVVHANFQTGMLDQLQEPSDKVIGCLREANARLPDSHKVSTALAVSVFERFRIAHSNDDYEEAMAILDKVIRAPGDRLTEDQEEALGMASSFALGQFCISNKPEDLEHAIYHTHTFLSEVPPSQTRLDDRRIHVMKWLSQLRRDRFDYLGIASSVQEPHHRTPGLIDHRPFQDMIASFTELNAESRTIRANTSLLSTLSMTLPTKRNLKRLSSIVGFCLRLLITVVNLRSRLDLP